MIPNLEGTIALEIHSRLAKTALLLSCRGNATRCGHSTG
jgi:hypothetical protein